MCYRVSANSRCRQCPCWANSFCSPRTEGIIIFATGCKPVVSYRICSGGGDGGGGYGRLGPVRAELCTDPPDETGRHKQKSRAELRPRKAKTNLASSTSPPPAPQMIKAHERTTQTISICARALPISKGDPGELQGVGGGGGICPGVTRFWPDVHVAGVGVSVHGVCAKTASRARFRGPNELPAGAVFRI